MGRWAGETGPLAGEDERDAPFTGNRDVGKKTNRKVTDLEVDNGPSSLSAQTPWWGRAGRPGNAPAVDHRAGGEASRGVDGRGERWVNRKWSPPRDGCPRRRCA